MSTERDQPDQPDDLPDAMPPRRPTGDVGQGARQQAPTAERDPAALARAVIERRGY